MKRIFNSEHVKKMVLSVLTVVAIVALITGVTTAWFTNRYRLASIGKIHPLTAISILAPGDTVIQSIDLSYDKSEVQSDGRVVLKRPFLIRSETELFDLCIAHTTNTSGLTIELYEANDEGREGKAYLAGITEKGTPYYWNRKEPITNLFKQGKYLNLVTGSNQVIADKEHDAHKKTFPYIGSGNEQNFYAKVQKYAEPLYWVKEDNRGVRRGDGNVGDYYTNYILEISWIETDKETDLLYIIAQGAGAVDEGGNE